MRRFLFLVFGSFLTCHVIAQPTISSFSPASGPVGTTVTITGTNFNTTAANNIVFFGAVRANVTAATSTSLTVTSPAGANYKPITVTTGGLTAYANKPFLTSFPGAGATLAPTSFEYALDSTTDLNSNQVIIEDIDGDGKPDIATSNSYSVSGSPASFSVLRNTSSGAGISFAPVINFQNGVQTCAIATGDIDGDGKPDIVVSSVADQNISIFRNTSTPGNISFAPKVNYTSTGSSYNLAIADLNGDGKPEIAVLNYLAGNITLYRNTSTIGAVSFLGTYSLTTFQGPRSVYLQDMDGDGKADVVSGSEFGIKISVFRNTIDFSNGFWSFAARVDFAANGPVKSIDVADLDGDGKADVGSVSSLAFSLFRNISTPGTIAFDTRIDMPTSSGTNIRFGDLNGDGKIDVYVSPQKIYQNISNPGVITMSSGQTLPMSGLSAYGEIGDLNGDSWPDLVVVTGSSDAAYVFKSRVNLPGVISFSPTAANSGETVTITGVNFTTASAVSFGGVPATSFTVVNSTTITAVVGVGGASGDVSVTNPYGTGILPGFSYSAPPVINSFTPQSEGYGNTVTISGNNFYGTTAVKFGGTNALFFTVNNATTITATVAAGATGDVSVTTPYGTATKPGFTYLPIPIINSFTPTSTGQGNTVNITGLNFTGVTAVAFGGVPAQSFIVNSSSSITATVGAGADGNVSVTNTLGTGSKPGFVFVPAPTITSFTPATGFCGTVMTITGTNFTATALVTVGATYYNPGDYTLVSSTTIQLTLCGTNNGNVSVTTAGGTATMPGFIFYYTANVTKIVPSTGGAGMPVAITGTEFRGVTGVSIGGVPVSSYTVVSPDTIKAIVGAGASGGVAVYNPATTGTSTVQFNFADWPVITSFFPRVGPVGTLVNIIGSGFSTTLSNNVVYFGATKATVVSATANLLKVKVPYGATYKGITVTRTDINKTGLYDVPFTVTFPGGGTAFDSTSFAGRIIIRGAKRTSTVIDGDIDGDGKPDIILSYIDTTIISVFRNTSTSLELTFAQPVNIPVNRGVCNITTADLNGDGKLDIIGSVGDHLQGFTVLKNNSTAGTISFDPYSQLNGPIGVYDAFTVADISLDGKPDVIGGCIGCSRDASFDSPMYFYGAYNSGTGGTINYNSSTLFGVNNLNAFDPFFLTQVITRDMNNDNKPDLVMGTNGEFFLVFINQSVGSYIGYDLYGVRLIGNDNVNGFNFPNYQIGIADINNDSLPDVISSTKIWPNLGDFNFQGSPNTITEIGPPGDFSDIDGDGKLDYSRGNHFDSAVFAVQNTTNNTISFAGPVGYKADSNYFYQTQLVDLNADSKPEIIAINMDSNYVLIYKNKIGTATLCPGGSTILTSSIATGTNFQWQVNTGSGFVNVSNNAQHAGVNTPNLQLMNIPSSWHGYQYRCVVDGNYSLVYALQFSNSWTGVAGTAWENPANWSCGTVPDSNTNVVLMNGTIVINSNVTINTLSINPGVNLTVSPGNNLTVLH